MLCFGVKGAGRFLNTGIKVNTPDFSGNSRLKRKAILNGIKAKGGLYGRAAEMYMNDDEKGDQFIKECAEQCHNKLAQDMWGEQLVSDILKYSMSKTKKRQDTIWRSKSMAFIPIES